MSLEIKLKEIQQRADNATSGPWKQAKECSFCYSDCGDVIALPKADNEFIAHSRQDIPKLLAVIKLLIEKNEGWCRLYHKHAAMYYNEEYSEQSIIEDMASDRLEIAKILEDEK